MPSLWWSALLVPLLWIGWRRPVWLPLAFLVAGVVWATLRAGWVLGETLPSALEGRDLQVEGHVADIPQPTDRGERFAFDIVHASAAGQPVKIPDRVLLNRRDDGRALNAGEHWRFVVRLKRPHGFQNPGGFDYEGALFQQRIRATGYVHQDAPSELLPGSSPRYAINRLRQRLGARMRMLLADAPRAGVIVALANGDRRGIGNQDWETLRRTGTNHLIAISGLHIGLVAGFVFFLARFLWALPGRTVLWLPAPKFAAVAALVAATAYAALAGFSVPTERALIMLAVAMIALLAQRRLAPSVVLAIALLAVLLYDPLAVMSAGFWLSFAAVAVILFSIQSRRGARIDWRRIGTLQWAIAVGLLPLMLVLFQQVSLVGPLANMLAVPVFTLAVVPLTLLGVVALGLHIDSVAGWLFTLAHGVLEVIWQVLVYLGSFSYSLWVHPRPGVWALVSAFVGVTLLLAPRGWPARWLGGLWLLPIFFTAPAAPLPGEVWFTLLDVGQGLATVVRTHAHVLVYDTGARFSSRFDAGRAVVVPYLRSQGVDRIDTLIISHGDDDHIGGARSVLESVAVKRILTSVVDRLPGSQACIAGQRWQWDGVAFSVLHPPEHYRRHGNDASCVLRISSAYGNILLPGDIEAAAERELVRTERPDLAADLLVVPHQGSKTSSTEDFVDAVHPRIAMFPVGYRNPFHHPHPDVRARYLSRGIELYESPTDGAVEIALRAAGIQARAYRQYNRRYWFSR